MLVHVVARNGHDAGVSYDFLVFGRGELVADALDQALAPLQCEGGSEFRCVSREVRGHRVMAFTIDGPLLVEPEDVPDDLRARIVAPTVTLQVSVPGDAARDVALAKRVATAVGKEIRGGVFDPQTGAVVWPRTTVGGRAVRLPRTQRVDALELEWFLTRASAPTDLPTHLLGTLRRTLPEALPRRFGDIEPLQYRLDRDGDHVFHQLAMAEDMLFWDCRRPFVGGHLSGFSLSASDEAGQDMGPVSISTQLLLPTLTDPAWRDEVIDLFRSVAGTLNCFYAQAAVGRGYASSRLASDGKTRSPAGLADHDQWLGLPDHPVWLAWFGEPYISLIDGFLPGLSFVRTSDHPDAGTELELPTTMKVRSSRHRYTNPNRAEVVPLGL